MNRIARRGLATVATGLLALGLTACGGLTDAGSGNDTGGADDSAATEEETIATLDCSDLEDKVWEHAPEPDLPISETSDEGFDALAGWMVDNGPNFEDAELGTAVVTWGELGAPYFNDRDGTAEEPISGEDFDAFEAASATIDGACPNIGFGLTSEE